MLLSALGTFGFTIFNVALYSALTFMTAINVSVEHAGMPMHGNRRKNAFG
ncbi:MAG: hypothetical protein AB7P20_08815 [Rhizobiaceae bacterium]